MARAILAALAFDVQGYFEFEDVRGLDVDSHQARTAVSRILDTEFNGGVDIDDRGVAQGDRSLSFQVPITAEDLQRRLKQFMERHSQCYLSLREGLFRCRRTSWNIQPDIAVLTFQVEERVYLNGG